MNFTEIKAIISATCKKFGVEEYEIFYTVGEDISAETLKDEVSAFSSGESAKVYFRCLVDGHMGYSSSSFFDADEFELKLEKILSSIKDAGRVEVMISYQSGIENVPLLDTKDSNTVTEESGNSSNRRVEQNSMETSIIFNQEKSGNKVPYISKTIMPKIEGVIVTCDGGGSEIVRSNVIKAVTVVTGITANKVQVFLRDNDKR